VNTELGHFCLTHYVVFNLIVELKANEVVVQDVYTLVKSAQFFLNRN